MSAFVIVATQGLTDALLATFIGQATGIIRTKWTADGLKAGQTIAAVAILMTAKGR